MRIDIAFLPATAAAFMLMFARIGTMIMLLPGLGELTVPVRIRLTIALILAGISITMAPTRANTSMKVAARAGSRDMSTRIHLQCISRL